MDRRILFAVLIASFNASGIAHAGDCGKIDVGMTLQQVENLQGGEGKRVSLSSTESTKRETYRWHHMGLFGESNDVVTLQNGKVTSVVCDVKARSSTSSGHH